MSYEFATTNGSRIKSIDIERGAADDLYKNAQEKGYVTDFEVFDKVKGLIGRKDSYARMNLVIISTNNIMDILIKEKGMRSEKFDPDRKLCRRPTDVINMLYME